MRFVEAVGFGRLLIKETELDGTRVPPGYTISVFMKQVHRNPELYPDPNTFKAFR
jgi:cytochrome P450